MRQRRHPLGIRARWWWHRHPVGGWGLSVGLVVAVLTGVPGFIDSRDEGRAPNMAPALVAAGDLPIGHRIRAADLIRRMVETATSPGTPVDDPVGRVLTALVLEGEPLVAERLSPAGADGAAALVPPGDVAIAVPIALAAPPIVVGDHLDVFVTDVEGFSTRRAATRGLVVAVTEEAITVSLGPAEASAVADGLAAGAVTLALLGPGP